MGWTAPQVHGGTLLLTDGTRVPVGSPDWFSWLAQAPSFSYHSPTGTFTARKERFQRGGWYWKAYRKFRGKLRSAYLGLPDHLTAGRLEEAARILARPASIESPDASDSISAGRQQVPDARQDTPGASRTPAFPRTKILVPPVRGALLPRERLLARLDEAKRLPLTILSAPAGYGKTTLLSAWLAERAFRAAWVSIEPEDNDATRFWRCVVSAVEAGYPGVTAPEPVRSIVSAQQLVLPLIEALSGGASGACQDRLVLVLDDYHLIEMPIIHESVTYLLDHLPPTLSVVIAGRSDPPLPLSRWRAHGHLAELRTAELSFSHDEVAAYFRRTLGERVSTHELETLEARAEGWIAGMQLALLTLRQAPDQMGNRRIITQWSMPTVTEFFIEEVFARQPEEIQGFLLATSVLDRFCAELCDAVTGNARSQEIMAQIERANLFLVPLDAEGIWFRYHHLFSEALRRRLHQTALEQAAALYLRAARWFHGHGMVFEAIEHGLAAQAYSLAAGWIGAAADAVEHQGETFTLLRWLSALPEPVLAADPPLCVVYARALATVGEADRAEAVIQLLERSRPAEGARALEERFPALQGRIAAIRAENAMARSDFHSAVKQFQLAAELLPDELVYLRTEVTAGLGTAYLAIEDTEAGMRAYAAARRIGMQSGNCAAVLGSSTSQGFLHLLQGDLIQARQVFEQALRFAGEHDSETTPLASMVYLGLGEVLYQWNELAAADLAMEQAVELSRRWGDTLVLVRSHIALATVRLARGDRAGAQAALDHIDPDKVALPSRISRLAKAAEARFAVVIGDIERADLWAHELGLSPDMPTSYPEEHGHLIFTRLLIAQGRWDDAGRMLSRLQMSAEGGKRWGKVIEILMLRALALQGQDRADEALDRLAHALTLARPGGYARLFLDEGRPLKALLTRLMREPRRGDPAGDPNVRAYIRRLLAAEVVAVSTCQPPGLERGTRVEPLSPQEAVILPLLAEGRSNREIARELVVETSTVKWHLKQIYAKLGVQNRMQAIRQARAYGWID
jgi:LuxR family transcriptional regulator, maltose regulon positive regulatory protein